MLFHHGGYHTAFSIKRSARHFHAPGNDGLQSQKGYHIRPASEISILITDTGAPVEVLTSFERHGVRIFRA